MDRFAQPPSWPQPTKDLGLAPSCLTATARQAGASRYPAPQPVTQQERPPSRVLALRGIAAFTRPDGAGHGYIPNVAERLEQGLGIRFSGSRSGAVRGRDRLDVLGGCLQRRSSILPLPLRVDRFIQVPAASAAIARDLRRARGRRDRVQQTCGWQASARANRAARNSDSRNALPRKDSHATYRASRSKSPRVTSRSKFVFSGPLPNRFRQQACPWHCAGPSDCARAGPAGRLAAPSRIRPSDGRSTATRPPDW